MIGIVKCKCGKLPNVTWRDGGRERNGWFLEDTSVVELECKTCCSFMTSTGFGFLKTLYFVVDIWNRDLSRVQS